MPGRPKNHMKTFGFWFYHELLPMIGEKKARLVTPNAEYMVKMESSRLECLRRNPKCVKCGLEGTIWILQSHKDEAPHINLYAVTPRHGYLVLMTQDHILPKCHGGSSEQTNLQTMCTHCNKDKGCSLPTSTQV